jgi:mono/diheme cytochrome c family protein
MKPSSLLRAAILPVAISTLSVGFALGVAFAVSPSPSKAIESAALSPSQISGRNLFVQSCAHCHGDDAKGSGEDGDGPDLHCLRISDARIANVITKGIRGEMPSFSRKFSATDTKALVDYLRSLK